MIIIMVFFLGCAAHNAANERSTEAKQIVDIIIGESVESLIVTIVGNYSLNHTETKQLDPIGLLFTFPDTSLAVGSTYYQSPANEIIRFIQAEEVLDDNRTVSRIFVALQKDTPHSLTQSKTELQIVFTKPIVPPKNTNSTKIPTEKEAAPKSNSIIVPAATHLETVAANPLEDKITVTIKANGNIKNYQPFTIAKPPRIVFDLYNLKSPFAKERKIAVQSQWVKQIRYFGHPNKLRLVIDTHNSYLSKYSSAPTDTGLIIHVGKSD